MTDRKEIPKSEKPKCPKCHIGGYVQGQAADGRPAFACTRCHHTWTCGKDGGEYAK